jgi:hypothetical protein
MSLRGTLLDLGLGELLQLAALARKSGVLELHCGPDSSWIGFTSGGIVRLARSHGALEPKQVLREAGMEDEPDPERRAFCIQDAAVQALLEMFEWTDGSFTFHTGADPNAAWPGPSGLVLDPPISPQFVALEGARFDDEAPRPAAAQAGGSRSKSGPPAVIVVDDDLPLLERIKLALAPSGRPVHIFRSSADGLARLKQYLVRGEIPALVLGSGACDPLEPRRRPGWRALARRARSLVPGIRLILILPEPPAEASEATAVLPQPPPGPLTGEDTEEFLRKLADFLGLRA